MSTGIMPHVANRYRPSLIDRAAKEMARGIAYEDPGEPVIVGASTHRIEHWPSGDGQGSWYAVEEVVGVEVRSRRCKGKGAAAAVRDEWAEKAMVSHG